MLKNVVLDMHQSLNASFFFIAYWPRSESTAGTGASGEIKSSCSFG
jgi:hypothetical protein